MRVLVVAGACRTVVEVAVEDPDATVADLARALGLAGAHGLLVDGALRGPAEPLLEAGLVRGCTVGLPGDADLDAGSSPGWGVSGPEVVLGCVAGPHAGRRWVLRDGPWVLGRSVWADLTVDDPALSARHCRLLVDDGSVVVADLGSGTGTRVDGSGIGAAVPLGPGQVLRVGGGAYRVAVAPHDRPSSAQVDAHSRMSGTVLFHRPPRSALPPGPEPLVAPAGPEPESRPGPLGIAALVVPFALAAVMVVVMGSWLIGLLALCGALATVAAAGEARTRRFLRRRRAVRLRREVGAALAAAADGYRSAERVMRWSRVCDPAEAVRRATGPSTRLWERRPGSDDWMALLVGVADLPHRVPLLPEWGPGGFEHYSGDRLDGTLVDAPVAVGLADRTLLGLCGPPAPCQAVARSLVVQAAVTTGPGDLRIVVLTDPHRAHMWEWARWLPHTRAGVVAGAVAGGIEAAREVVAALDAAADETPILVVVDSEDLLSQRGSPARRLLSRAAGGVVLTGAPDRIPASAAVVAELAPDGGAALAWPHHGERLDGVLAAGLDLDTASLAARRLARFEDADADDGRSGLPVTVALLPLLGLTQVDAASVSSRWAKLRRPQAVLGATADGICTVDLVADGPHALVVGTTGAGKSELLRSLVLSLGLDQSPERLAFVLVDYKGGSAFDRCAELPHVVGYVTDLDAHLGARALICLEAELVRREKILRQHGAADIAELHAGAPHPPIPRLVVVVDEFATLAAELAGFVPSLVGIAQRGRSLGVHLLLATQRPGGAVTDDIRANTNLRVALRVQDEHDSVDVIGVRDAAHIDRSRPGQALLRLGHGDVAPFQAARCTGPYGPTGRAPVTARMPAGGETSPAAGQECITTALQGDGPTELASAVEAILDAFCRSGRPAPARPWPEPLPPFVDIGALAADIEPVGIGLVTAADERIVVGVCDEPRAQRQLPLVWCPPAGNLIVVGRPRSGRSTALSAVAAAMAAKLPPSDVHLYIIDAGGGGLRCLADLPHTAAVITPAEDELMRRMLDRLGAELDARLSGSCPPRPRIVVLVDGWPGPAAATDDLTEMRRRDALARLWTDGPPVGISLVAAADRLGAIEPTLTSITAQKWLLQPAEDTELDLAGVPRQLRPGFVPGRLVATDKMLEAQIGWPASLLDRAGSQWHGCPVPEPLGTLPAVVPASALPPARSLEGEWLLPMGIGDRDLAPVTLTVRPGDHVLVAGPRRSGRSTALALIAEHLTRLGVPWWTLAAGDGAGAAEASGTSTNCTLISTGRGASSSRPAELVAELRRTSCRGVLLVDDAERWADPEGVLAGVVTDRDGHLAVVAAVRADAASRGYGHWTRTVAASGRGVLLRPEGGLDAGLLGVHTSGRLGERYPGDRPLPARPGLGVLVQDGEAVRFQMAIHEIY